MQVDATSGNAPFLEEILWWAAFGREIGGHG